MLLSNVLQHSNNYNYVNYAEFGTFGNNKRITLGFFNFKNLKNQFKKHLIKMLSIDKKITLNDNYIKKDNITFIHKSFTPNYMHARMGYFACDSYNNSLMPAFSLNDAGNSITIFHIIVLSFMHDLNKAVHSIYGYHLLLFYLYINFKCADFVVCPHTAILIFSIILILILDSARSSSNTVNINLFGRLFLSRAGYFMNSKQLYIYANYIKKIKREKK